MNQLEMGTVFNGDLLINMEIDNHCPSIINNGPSLSMIAHRWTVIPGRYIFCFIKPSL